MTGPFFKQISVVVIILGLSSIASAQAWFSPGYLIDNSGDTLHGYLSDRSLAQNSREVHFKSSAKGKSEKVYYPGEIKEYFIESGKLYRTMVLPNGQRSFAEPESKVIFYDTVFAAIALEGNSNLYYYRDRRDYHHVYFEVDGKLRELVEKVPEGFEDSQDLFATKEMQQSMFSDCPEVETKIAEAPIKPVPQQKLFESHLDCLDGDTSEFRFEFDRTVMRPHVLLGGNFANCKFSQIGSNPLNGIKLNYRAGFAFGAGLTFESTAKARPLSLSLDVMLQSLNAGGEFRLDRLGFDYVDYGWNLNVVQLKTPVLVRYAMPTSGLQPFFELGGVFGWWVKFDFIENRTNYYTHRDPVTIEPKPVWEDPLSIRRLEQSLIAGIGVQKGRFAVRARYERGNGYTAGLGWSVRTQSWQLLTEFKL